MCCIKIALRRSFFEKTVQIIANGTDKGGSFVTVVRLETKLRATLTEQQKAQADNTTDMNPTELLGQIFSNPEMGKAFQAFLQQYQSNS